ncbi:hypothetical protein V6C16_06155, partial [Desulfovibrio sp. 1188_IL3213]
MSAMNLSRPAQGQAVTIVATSKNAKIALDFSTDGVTLSRDGDSLVFTFEDEAAIRIDDFYTSYHADNVPEFEVAGKIVSGTEFFSALGPDLIPAAGPASVERGSHYNEYGASDLMGGLDHLDGLDMSVAGSVAGSDSLQTALLNVGGASSGAAPGGGAALGVPSGDVRAVLYSAGDSENHFVSTPVFFRDAGGNLLNLSSGAAITRTPSGPDSVSCTFPPEWDSSWLAEPEFSDGQLVFRFSEAGLAKLQSLDPGDFLRGFVTVTVVKDGHTFEYIVEVVASGGSSFDSQAYDAKYGAVSGFGTESVGEYHQGTGQTGRYQIVASTGDDEIIINDTVIGGSSIHASGSADPAQMADDYNTINLNAGVANTTPGSTTHITSADGKLTVLDGVLADGSVANVIHMGKGSVHVQSASSDGVSAAHGVFAVDGGKNTISGGSISIAADEQGLQAQSGSVNSVTAIDGDITINALWNGVGTVDNSTTNLSATNGSVSINSDWGISTTGNSRANVYVTDGNLNVDALQRGIHALDDSTNTVSVTNGNVDIKGGWEGVSAQVNATNKIDVTGGSVVINSGWRGIGASSDGSANNLTITDGSLHVAGAKTGVIAVDDGANSITVAGGDIFIASTDAADLAAVSATSGGKNTIGAVAGASGAVGGKLTLDGGGTGLNAESGGVNSIQANDIIISAGTGHGVYATDADSENTIDAGADGTVTVSAGGSGLLAQTGGENIVKGGDISITGSAYGVYANGSDSVNIIGGVGGSVSITSGNFLGVLAYNGGENRVTGNNIAIKTGISAFGGKSENTIDAGVDGKVTISGNVSSDLGGTNTITGKEITAVSVGSSRSAYSSELLRYVGSSNELRTGADGTVSISSGVEASTCGNNTIASGAIFVGSPDSVAVNAGGQVGSGIGTNTLKVGEQGKVSIHGGSTGIYAANGGINSVTGGEVDIYGGNNGINSQNFNSKNIIDAGYSGKVSVRSLGTALLAQYGSENTVKAGDITINGAQVYALSAVGTHSRNSVDTGTDGVVRITGGDVGLWSQSGAQNSITGGDITIISANSGTENSGIVAVSSGSNTIKAGFGGTVAISGDTGVAAKGGTNVITTTEKSDVVVSGSTGGILASSSGSNKIETAGGDVTVTAEAGSGDSTGTRYGMSAIDSGSNSITTESGTVTVSGSSAGDSTGTRYGYGMNATSDGSNEIKITGDGTVTVSGSSAGDSTGTRYGYGMSADNFGSNEIKITGDGTVTVSGSSAGDSTGTRYGYGMNATSDGSNEI